MYDTVYFWLYTTENITEHLTNLEQHTKCETGETWFSGKVSNLNVNQYGSGIIIKGSLPKYYFGNNYKVLTRKDTEQAIKNIGEHLKINLDNAFVYRIDIAQNFIVMEPVGYYFTSLCDLNYFKRFEQGNRETLRYQNYRRELVFYNKLNELKAKKVDIPPLYSNRHLLRYEYRIRKRLAKEFNREHIYARDLYDEEFYISIIDKWHDMYFNIQRHNNIKQREGIELNDVRQLQNFLALLGLKQIGEREILNMIDREKNNLSSIQYSRLKKKIKDLSTSPEFTEPSDTILELDRKIRQAVRHYR